VSVLGESLLRFSRSNATESHGGCSRDVVSKYQIFYGVDLNNEMCTSCKEWSSVMNLMTLPIDGVLLVTISEGFWNDNASKP